MTAVSGFFSRFDPLHTQITQEGRSIDSSTLDELSSLVDDILFDEKSAFEITEEFLGGEGSLSSKRISSFADFCSGDYPGDVKKRISRGLDKLKILAIQQIAKRVLPKPIADILPFKTVLDHDLLHRINPSPSPRLFLLSEPHSPHSPLLSSFARNLSLRHKTEFSSQSDFLTVFEIINHINKYKTIPDLLNGICSLLQDDSVKGVRIVYNKQKYISPGFKETSIKLKQNLITVECETGNYIEVFYDYPQLEDLQNFIDIVSIFTSMAIDNLETHEKLSVQSKLDLSEQFSHSLCTTLTDIPLSSEYKDELKKASDEFLFYQFLTSGKARKETKQINLSLELQALVDKKRSEVKGLTLTVDLGQVPQIAICDFEKISKIISALIDNAVKSSKPNGHIHLEIKMLEQPDGLFLEILVDDNGEGIPENDQPNVFKPFGIRDSRISLRNRHGLGLSNAFERAKLLEGKLVLLRNQENEGSTFKATIPIVMQDTTSSLGVISSQAIQSALKRSKTTMTVLIVDDEPIARNFLQKMSKKEGFSPEKIAVVEDGSYAVAKFKENPRAYDLVIMDRHMPLLNGIEASRQIRDIQQAVQIERGSEGSAIVILCTAGGLDGVSLEEQELFDGNLPKSPKISDFKALMAKNHIV